MVKKLFNSEPIHSLFKERPISYNLRNLRPFFPQDTNLNYINFSSTKRLGQLWNLIPRDKHESPSLEIYKNKIMPFLLTRLRNVRTGSAQHWGNKVLALEV